MTITDILSNLNSVFKIFKGRIRKCYPNRNSISYIKIVNKLPSLPRHEKKGNWPPCQSWLLVFKNAKWRTFLICHNKQAYFIEMLLNLMTLFNIVKRHIRKFYCIYYPKISQFHAPRSRISCQVCQDMRWRETDPLVNLDYLCSRMPSDHLSLYFITIKRTS